MLSAGRKQVTTLSVKTLVNYVKNEKIKLDNAVQRTVVWDVSKKSKLIYSILCGIEIPSFNCNKLFTEDDNNRKFILDLIDGKQRATALTQFLSGEFALTGIDDVVIEDTNEELNLNTNYFDDLSEDLKDIILSYNCRFITYESMTDEEIRTLFMLLNNGVSLSQVELSRVKCPCFDTIYGIAKHELFRTCLTEKAIDKYKNEDIIFKSLQMLTAERPCLDKKVMTPFIESLHVDTEMEQRLNRIYDRMMNVYNMIVSEMENTSDKDIQKMNKKLLRKMSSQTHIISLAKIVDKSLELGLTDEQYKGFISKFFGTKGRECSISSIYNVCISGGSGHADKVAHRDEELSKVFTDYIKSIVIRKSENKEQSMIDTVEAPKDEDTNEEVSEEVNEETNDSTVSESDTVEENKEPEEVA